MLVLGSVTIYFRPFLGVITPFITARGPTLQTFTAKIDAGLNSCQKLLARNEGTWRMGPQLGYVVPWNGHEWKGSHNPT